MPILGLCVLDRNNKLGSCILPSFNATFFLVYFENDILFYYYSYSFFLASIQSF